MTTDKPAVQYGADCAHCPLRTRPFVSPEPPTAGEARFVILGESPDAKDVLARRPFCGFSGRKLNTALRAVGLAREEALLLNAVACQPPQQYTETVRTKALVCCAPYREALLAGAPAVPLLAVGGDALRATTGKDGIFAWYGYPLEAGNRQVFPSLHPRFVSHVPVWQEEWQRGIQRFSQLVQGVFKLWVNKHMVLGPERLAILQKMNGAARLTVDLETFGLDTIHGDILNVGIADDVASVSVPWPASHAEEVEVRRLLAGSGAKVFHNAQHDLSSLAARTDCQVNGPVEDTLLMHAALYPQLPHKLAIAGARLNRPRWKAVADESEYRGGEKFAKMTPKVREAYNCDDVRNTHDLWAELRPLLDADFAARKVYEELTALAPIALGMRRKGLIASSIARQRHMKRLGDERAAAKAEFATLWPAVSLGEMATNHAVHNLFWNTLECQPLQVTDSGAKVLDAWTLLRFSIGFGAFSEKAQQTAAVVLRYRQAAHLIHMLDSLPVSPDGRMHPPWAGGWAAVSGRWGCGRPNLMNWPKRGANNIRDLLVPDPGCLFVAADLDKVEVRFVAILANDQPFLEAFEAGQDTHLENAKALFGPAAGKLERDMGKIAAHAFDYDGSAEVVWQQLVKKFPKLSLAVVKEMRRRYRAAHPDLCRWQEQEFAIAQQQGVYRAAVGYRRIFFPDRWNIDPGKIYNFQPQSGVAYLVNRAMCRLHAEGWDLRINLHDELVLNVPKPDVLSAAAALKAALEEPVVLRGREWVMPVGELKVGKSWGAMMPLDKAHELLREEVLP